MQINRLRKNKYGIGLFARQSFFRGPQNSLCTRGRVGRGDKLLINHARDWIHRAIKMMKRARQNHTYKKIYGIEQRI